MNKFLQFSVLCTLLLCTSLSTKAAYLIKFSDIDFDAATNSITAYHNTTEKDIEIPANFVVGPTTYTVKIIGENAFAGKGLTGVVMPNTIITIMNDAFKSNQLVTVAISDNIKTIGSSAFSNNNLTKVTLSQNVEKIGYYAFHGNWNIEPIELPKRPDLQNYRWVSSSSSVGELEGGAVITNHYCAYTAKWYDPYQLTLDDVDFETTTGTINKYINTEHDDIIIPSSFNVEGQNVEVKIIGSNAFSGKELGTVELPNTLTIIDYSGFYNNHLKSVIIPQGVELLGVQAFASNKLEEVFLPNTLKTIQNHAFRENKLSKLELPEGLESIYKSAFYRNEIETLTLPTSVTTIGAMAFNRNNITTVNGKSHKGLFYKRNNDGSIDSTTVVSYGGTSSKIDFMSEKLITISAFAFSNSVLDTVIIPNNVKTIERSAFYECSIISVSLPSSLEIIENNAFYHNQLTTLDIPTSTHKIDFKAFYSNKLTKVNIPNNVTFIGGAAFNQNEVDTLNGKNFNGIFYARNDDGTECKDTIVSFGKTRVKVDFIPDDVLHIGKNAFYNCYLDTLVLPNSLLSIGMRGVFSASNTNIVLPKHPTLSSLGWEDEFNNTFVCGYSVGKSQNNALNIPNQYSSITYDLDGGLNSTNNPAYFIHDDGVANFYDAIKEGYAFIGWFDIENNQVESIVAGTNTNMVLYAKWKDYSTAINTTESIKLEVYPNPANDFLNLKSSSNAPIEIYNLSGLLLKHETATNRINISELPSGIYLLKQDNYTVRFVKK